MLTLKRFRAIEGAIRAAGFASVIEWSEKIPAPEDADEFASEAIYVICNSGMKASVARPIYQRCLNALEAAESSKSAFGHPGKTAAIDTIWARRKELFAAFQAAEDKLAFCASLPFVGPITSHHLAKNYGVNTVKADVHLDRLAEAECRSVQDMCQRLAQQTGYRVATIDSILWRACSEGILDSRSYLASGWRAAFKPPTIIDPAPGAGPNEGVAALREPPAS